MQHSRWKEFQDWEKNSLCVHNIIFIILLPPKQRFLGITINLGLCGGVLVAGEGLQGWLL